MSKLDKLVEMVGKKQYETEVSNFYRLLKGELCPEWFKKTSEYSRAVDAIEDLVGFNPWEGE